jgi:putative transposase
MHLTPDAHYLPRLPAEYYRGDGVVLWTLPVFDRATGWLDHEFHLSFQNLMLHAQHREALLCPVYCLMPDHIHLIWIGLELESDQKNAMAFLRTHLEPLLAPHKFQPQAHDSVFRERDRKKNAFARACGYVLDNPVRKGLATSPGEWPFLGAVISGYPKVSPWESEYWPLFWRIYADRRGADADNILRPPIV